jgi:hypothetical protein
LVHRLVPGVETKGALVCAESFQQPARFAIETNPLNLEIVAPSACSLNGSASPAFTCLFRKQPAETGTSGNRGY